MGTESPITNQLIIQACSALAAEGVRPTNELVRNRLAAMTGTKGGSYSTIGPVVRGFNAERKAAEARGAAREPAPAEVLEKLQAMGVDLWAIALSRADDRLAAERTALDRTRQELEAETSEAFAVAERAELQREEDRRGAAAEIKALRETVAASQKDAAQQAAKAAAGHARADEVQRRAEDLQARLAREEAARQGAEGQYAQSRSVAARLEQQLATLSTQLELVTTDLAEARAAAQTERDRAMSEREAERARTDAAMAILREELAAARHEAREATSQLARSGGRIEELEAQLARNDGGGPGQGNA